jgi:hypothetical protein
MFPKNISELYCTTQHHIPDDSTLQFLVISPDACSHTSSISIEMHYTGTTELAFKKHVAQYPHSVSRIRQSFLKCDNMSEVLFNKRIYTM